MGMRCPFLEEVLVRYCKAYPVKKLIPCSNTPSLCLTKDYVKCSEYLSVAGAEEAKEVKKMSTQEARELPGKERQCIWMKLGVVSYRLCTLNYDCNRCEFNQALMDASSKYAEASEMFDIINRLRNLPASQRKCRYMLMGEVSYKLCSNNYQCGACEYDQMMQDSLYLHPKVLARQVKVRQIKVRKFLILEHLYYYKKHTWVKIKDSETVRVGLDDFAQKLLGKMEEIELPEVGRKIVQGEAGWQIKTRMGSAKLLSPIDGVITNVNEELSRDASLLNNDPYNKGWVIELRPFDLDESLKKLLRGDKTKEWLNEEIDRLNHKIESSLGVTVADGGELVNTIEKINKKEWEDLVKDFLLI